MAFGMFRKHLPDEAAPAVAPQVSQIVAASEPDPSSEGDATKEILELLELELGGMVRQLERAANAVGAGAKATAAKLATIRGRTDALSGRSNAAQSTANTFTHGTVPAFTAAPRTNDPEAPSDAIPPRASIPPPDFIRLKEAP